MEIDVIAIIQIDATIIAGILILLTITNFVRTTNEFWLPNGVASIVIPFAISAMLAIWELIKEFSTTPEGNFIPISLVMMFVGFIYLIAVVMKISIKKNWRNKSK